jgi:hypothetical protein
VQGHPKPMPPPVMTATLPEGLFMMSLPSIKRGKLTLRRPGRQRH